MNPRLTASFLLSAVICLHGFLHASDWPFFRGPNLDGVSNETGWKTDVSNIAWRADVGVGASSVVVVGDQVIAMGNKDNKDIISCLNAEDGKPIWKFAYDCRFEGRQYEGGTASTPTVDGKAVYTFSYDGQLHCIALSDGKLAWKKDVKRDFGGNPPGWKYAGSPLVVGNLVVLDIGGNGNSTVAVDKRNGNKIWGEGNENSGYSTPVPFKIGNQHGVIVCKAKDVVAYDLRTGNQMWRFDFETSYQVNASSPIVLDGKFLVSSGYDPGRCEFYELSRREPERLWVNSDMKTKMSSCVVVGDYVYGISERAGLMCINIKDGSTVWSDKRSARFGNGTLMAADGKLIILTERGELIVAEASPEGFKSLGRNQVLNGRCWVMPVLANGRIYCKDNSGNLVCVDVR